MAYFVLQGSASTIYSKQPYLFGFETSETSRPIIELTVSNPSVTIKVDATSDVDYLLAVNGNEPGNLRQPMSNYVLGTDKSLFLSGGTYASGTGTSGVYTVLDAMSNSTYKDGKLAGSVFDRYATQEAKDDFAEFIRSQTTTSGDVVMSGTATEIPANSSKTINCASAMVGTTWYTFLAVGKSTAGSGDAFRAIRPVFNTDATPPMITACNFVMTNTTPITSLTGICKGTLTIQFDEPLYWVEKSGVNQTVIPIVSSPGSLSNVYAASTAFTPYGGVISYSPGTGTTAIASATFDITAGRNGSYIVAETNVGDKSGNVHTVPLNIQLKYVANGDGTYTPEFVVAKDWDGR